MHSDTLIYEHQLYIFAKSFQQIPRETNVLEKSCDGLCEVYQFKQLDYTCKNSYLAPV